MKVLMWILQIVLALFFGNAGITKLTTPVDKLADTMGWVAGFPTFTAPVLGFLEVAAAVALIVPAALKTFEILTPLAAVGLALLMVGATITHLTRGEIMMLQTTIPAALIAAGVAWGRFRLLKIKRAPAEAAEASQ